MFRFTIRDVLWLTVVVALALGLGLGWWRDRHALSAKIYQERQKSLAESQERLLRDNLLIEVLEHVDAVDPSFRLKPRPTRREQDWLDRMSPPSLRERMF